MASETFKKRQKETARREKQRQKLARRLERKSEKARAESKIEEGNPGLAQLDYQHGPKIL